MLIIISVLCLIGIIILAVRTKFKHRLTISLILTIVLLLAQILLLLDTHTHWGIDLQTTQSQQTIAPLVSFPGDNNVLAYRNVGSGKTRKQIYIYKPSSRSNKKLMTYSDKVTILLERSPQLKAHRIKAVTRYHYHNTWAKILYAGVLNDQQVQKTNITFQLPAHWFVLSTQDLTTAGKRLKAQQAQMKATIASQVQAYLVKHPNQAADPGDIQKVETQFLQQYTAKDLTRYSVKINH